MLLTEEADIGNQLSSIMPQILKIWKNVNQSLSLLSLFFFEIYWLFFMLTLKLFFGYSKY